MQVVKACSDLGVHVDGSDLGPDILILEKIIKKPDKP